MGDQQRRTELSPYYLLRDPVEAEFAEIPPESEAPFRGYWRVVVKHRKLILSLLALTVATTAAVTFTLKPQYSAVATIQIERQAPDIAPVAEVKQRETDTYDKYDYYQTQYEILESRTIAAKTVKALGLEDDQRFRQGYTGGFSKVVVSAVKDFFGSFFPKSSDEPSAHSDVDPDLIERYRNSLSIEPIRNSRLVDIRFTTRFADLSAQLANRHVEEYVTASLGQRLETTLKAKDFLEAELAKVKDRVDGSVTALNKFRKDKNIISLDGGDDDIVSTRLTDLNERHTEAEADRIRLEGQYSLIQGRSEESLPDVLASPLVQQLKQELASVEAERANLGKKFKPGYPKMAQAVAREASLKQRLAAEISKIVSGIESSYLAARNREEQLDKQLLSQKDQVLAQKDIGADYDTLKRDVDTAQQLYSSLLQRLKDLDVAGEIKVTNVSVVDKAEIPQRASSPKPLLNLTIATLLGAMLGVGIAFFLEYLDDTLKTPEDLEHKLGLPALGVVPAFTTNMPGYGRKRFPLESLAKLPLVKGENGASGKDLVTHTDPRSPVSEAYRTIRTAILLSSADNPPKVILFTSGCAGEGKTVTAVNQALTLAQAGGRVLLIDGDIRKPRLHRLFNLPNGHGLSTYLTAQSSLAAVIHPITLNGSDHDTSAGAPIHPERQQLGGELHVIPAGPLPPNPAELVGSARMRETLDALRAQYDYILIDTPPVLPVTDAVLMSTMSDGVVLIVRAQDTPIDVTRRSRDRLTRARAKILGVVLNDVDVTSAEYGRYYRYQYSYYAERESA